MILKKKPSLSVSCVYYSTSNDVFLKTINSLLSAIEFAYCRGVLGEAEIHLINNNPDKQSEFLTLADRIEDKFSRLIIHNSHGNIGYGCGNNLAIKRINTDYHLILNPDVFQEKEALFFGLTYLQNNKDVDLVAPAAVNQHGEIEYLAKRQPSFLVLLLRAIDNPFLNERFRRLLGQYTYKDKYSKWQEFDIELASGCYMLTRTSAIKSIGGFNERYFLYFEDFDLSMRLRKKRLVRDIKITHLGGNVSKKSFFHYKCFLVSFIRYKIALFCKKQPFRQKQP